ncbi:hypothetical protein IJJ05_02030 [Candidatus Saccharibacteria bacterium]|nr:hypothetical protein [Candidatus Saccharibacteria bacterium]
MVKKGDTLIEVTLAVGIFSMIAIAVVSVMNSGTSGAQTALEATLTREEIDAQAEALRFIQNSAANGDERYNSLWKEIVSNAIDFTGTTYPPGSKESIFQFAPETCGDLYDNKTDTDNFSTAISQKAFIINTHGLGNFSNTDFTTLNSTEQNTAIENIFVTVNENNLGEEGIFSEASTYPHLIFTSASGSNSDSNSDSGALSDETNYNQLSKAEGIYIVAIKDKGTNIGGDNKDNKSAFIDFYIRTCWYGSNDQTPSTISTIIRLHDPNVME